MNRTQAIERQLDRARKYQYHNPAFNLLRFTHWLNDLTDEELAKFSKVPVKALNRIAKAHANRLRYEGLCENPQ